MTSTDSNARKALHLCTIVIIDSTYVVGFKNINHKGTYKQGKLIR